ncbi:membrane protease YdiL (CAAX protease family) [Lactobacillus colini]|uniref:Membrane protease YdiL (CAAX protease family) n=1 Tax=Lactobacillus colini TaxID=1819254 RepID=A0ABS4MCG0_9LACO|nr:CPBP family intramembrane glutamic endopeptidase [Lactobacillus colini]MBP2057359.1 membrane protease YdiL (CAAX protease family) [Lactobacillus colini]
MKHKQLLNIQIFFNLIWAIYELLNPMNMHKQVGVYIYGAIIILLAAFLITSNIRGKLSSIITSALSVIVLPYILLMLCGSFFSKLCEVLPNFRIGFQVIYFLVLSVTLIPNILQNYGKLNNWIYRLVSVLAICEGMLFNGGMAPQAHSIMTTVIKSGLDLAFAMLVTSYFLMKVWNIRYRINFIPKNSKNFQLSVLIILIIAFTWYILVDTFRDTIDTPLEAFWKFDFSILDPSQSVEGLSSLAVVLMPIFAAVFEETMRYVNLVIVLKGLKGRFRLELAVLISATIFALVHYGNIVTHQQSFVETNYQVAGSLGFGGMMAVLYLYTGQIWLPMLLHFLNDYILFAHTPLSTGTAGNFYGYGISPIVLEIIIIGISILFTILMLFGKRRKYMEENADKLIEPIHSAF